MNKGRNIFILMMCLICISLLAFLTLLEGENTDGVVDGVRYYLVSSEDDIKTYDFYFHEGDKMTADVTESASGEWTVNMYDWSYIYIISGTDRDNAVIEAYESGYFDEDESVAEPYDKFSKQLFATMVFGKEDVLQLWQAIVVFIIFILGGCCILFAEELWHIVKRKGKDDYPKWHEMSIYKRIGAGIMVGAAALLILFVVF